MDVNALRDFVNENPDGFEIVMIDGTRYRLPHRDYIWFTPSAPARSGPPKRLATSFWLHDPERDEPRLVHAVLVKEILPLPETGKKKRKGHAA